MNYLQVRECKQLWFGKWIYHDVHQRKRNTFLSSILYSAWLFSTLDCQFRQSWKSEMILYLEILLLIQNSSNETPAEEKQRKQQEAPSQVITSDLKVIKTLYFMYSMIKIQLKWVFSVTSDIAVTCISRIIKCYLLLLLHMWWPCCGKFMCIQLGFRFLC